MVCAICFRLKTLAQRAIASTFSCLQFCLNVHQQIDLGGSACVTVFFRGVCAFFPERTARKSSIHILRPDCPCGRLSPNQRASVDTIFRALRLHNHTLATASAVLQSQQDFVIMRCQSPHEAALGERLCLIAQPSVIALSVRFRVLYNRQSVFNADGIT